MTKITIDGVEWVREKENLVATIDNCYLKALPGPDWDGILKDGEDHDLTKERWPLGPRDIASARRVAISRALVAHGFVVQEEAIYSAN